MVQNSGINYLVEINFEKHDVFSQVDLLFQADPSLKLNDMVRGAHMLLVVHPNFK